MEELCRLLVLTFHDTHRRAFQKVELSTMSIKSLELCERSFISWPFLCVYHVNYCVAMDDMKIMSAYDLNFSPLLLVAIFTIDPCMARLYL